MQDLTLCQIFTLESKDLKKDQTLVLEHEHDGRDLDLDYAHNVCDHLLDLWGDDFKFYTIIEEEPFEI